MPARVMREFQAPRGLPRKTALLAGADQAILALFVRRTTV